MTLRPFRRLVLCALVVALTPGCGSIFGLAFDRGVTITSSPSGATVWVDGQVQEETTPANIGVWSGDDHVVEARVHSEAGVELKGQTTLSRGVRIGIVFLDLVFTGALGLLIDWVTGAMYYFDRDQVHLNLGSSEQAAESARERADSPTARDEARTTREPVRDLPPDDQPSTTEPWRDGAPTEAPHPGVDPGALDGPGDDEPIGPDPTVREPLQEPCGICDQPRGDVSPCPHCGMD